MICLILFILNVTDGHVVIKHPAPRYDQFDELKQYPCGSNNQYNAFSMGGTTDLIPGVQEFTFRETINHNGAPYRIAISFKNDDNFDDHVLLDNIPHNDQGSTKLNGKLHRVTVDVPDVDCVSINCSVQIVQVMTDKFDGICQPSDLANSCGNKFFVYFSCANVNINGTQNADSIDPFYRSYKGYTTARGWTTEVGDWNESNDGYWTLVNASGMPSPSSTGTIPSPSSTGTISPPPSTGTSLTFTASSIYISILVLMAFF